MIKIAALCKSFQDGNHSLQVLNQLHFECQATQSIAITGASGCGKSTLLHLLAGLDMPDSGSIQVNGHRLEQFSVAQGDAYRRQSVGLVFQRFNLIECLTVDDNIRFPAQVSGRLDLSYLSRLKAQLGVEELSHKLPVNLSGGQQQRVAIARALAHKPSLVLADEPTGNLDDHNSEQVARLLFETCRSNLATLIVVTHSTEIAQLADQHYQLHGGQLQLKHSTHDTV